MHLELVGYKEYGSGQFLFTPTTTNRYIMHNNHQHQQQQQAESIRHQSFSVALSDEKEDRADGSTVVSDARLSHASLIETTSVAEFSNDFQFSSKSIQSFEPVLTSIPSDLLPPISRQSLIELEEQSICRNVQILHDLLLEPHLRIKPNLEKRHSLDQIGRSEMYWALIKQEIQSIQSNSFKSTISPRFKTLLIEIKEILKELYPESQVLQEILAEHMDIELIITDMQMGYFDPTIYASLLHSVIKVNCAPKRDHLVDGLLVMAGEGKFVELLKSTLDLCELMKLDLINYRLTRIRPNYLASYSRIEREFVLKRHGSKMPVTEKWIRAIKGTVDLAAILLGTVDLCCVLLDEPAIPETFSLDSRRILLLRSRYQDLCILGSLLLVFRQWCKKESSEAMVSSVPLIVSDLKNTLEEMLRRPETRISSIADTIFQSLLLAQPCLINDVQSRLLNQIDRLMDPKSPLVLVLSKKMRSIIEKACKEENQLNDPQLWIHSGLSDIKTELLQLSRDLCTMAWANWTVHETVYRQIKIDAASQIQ